jgi:hypothetical protein
MEPAEGRGPPAGVADAKRPTANVPLRVDWHDYLIARREPGVYVALDARIRPLRADATGLQYRCTTPGVTSGVPFNRIRWPRTAGLTEPDGSVVWTAEPIDSNSLRASVSSDTWVVPTGLTLGTVSNNDLVYTALVDGGDDGITYEVRHRIVLSPAEDNEALILLPVRD